MNKTTLLSGLITSAMALGLTVGMPATASAAVIECNTLSPDISDKVISNAGCQILDPIGGGVNDKGNANVVNTGGFFGATSSLPSTLWTLGGKYLEDPVSPFTGVSITGTATAGSWSVTQAVLDMYEIMFIFKDGNDTNLVGYLINTTSGSYSTPFTFPPFVQTNGNDNNDIGGKTSANISHISVYYREGGGTTGSGPVPEPGTITLMGLGLLGALFYRRRTQRSSV